MVGFFSYSLDGVRIGYNTKRPSKNHDKWFILPGISAFLWVENQLLGNTESGNSGVYYLYTTTSISFLRISSANLLNSSLAYCEDCAWSIWTLFINLLSWNVSSFKKKCVGSTINTLFVKEEYLFYMVQNAKFESLYRYIIII